MTWNEYDPSAETGDGLRFERLGYFRPRWVRNYTSEQNADIMATLEAAPIADELEADLTSEATGKGATA